MKKILLLLLLLHQVTISQIINLQFENYNTVFDLQLKEPIYSHYILKYSEIQQKIKRKDFRKCPLTPSTQQASKADYIKDTIFDIGHLSPFLDLNQTKKTILETSYYTNTAPQNYKLNRGIWRQLELFIHELCKKNKYNIEIYTLVTYGENRMSSLKIPTYFYKLLIIEKKYFAFKFPNKPPENTNIFYYKINEIEVINLINHYNFEKIEIEKF